MALALADYPQLRLLAWHRRLDDSIDEEEAFALYEAHWRFVDEESLQEQERALIQYLTRRYGHGLLNV